MSRISIIYLLSAEVGDKSDSLLLLRVAPVVLRSGGRLLTLLLGKMVGTSWFKEREKKMTETFMTQQGQKQLQKYRHC